MECFLFRGYFKQDRYRVGLGGGDGQAGFAGFSDGFQVGSGHAAFRGGYGGACQLGISFQGEVHRQLGIGGHIAVLSTIRTRTAAMS